MELIYRGKTKDVYDLGGGLRLLRYKDDLTGADGEFDPGANAVGLTIDGMGAAALRMSDNIFKRLIAEGVKTHLVDSNLEAGEQTVVAAERFGEGVEFICRFRATGGFIRRYGLYAREGQPLDALVETTLKDDGRDDPPATKGTLEALGLLREGEFDELYGATRRIARIIKGVFAEKGLDLYDIKLEFGRGASGGLMLIDEVSPGNVRAYDGGEIVGPMDLARRFVG